MAKVISFFERMNDDVLRNHQHYARLMGYEHEWVESDHLAHFRMRTAYKYNVLLQKLKELKEGDLLLMLDGHSAIMDPIALEHLMGNAESLVIQGPTEINRPEIAYINMIVLRNTSATRQTLFEVLMALHGAIACQKELEEEELLQKFYVVGSNSVLNEVFINLSWRITTWHQSKIFVVNLGAPASYDADGKIFRNALHQMSHDLSLEKIMVKQINARLMNGTPLLQTPNYPAISEDPVSHFNPDSKIALITLYTHHINTYARVSEHNVKRYCDRHGYAYHVYRGIPAELDPAINGTWVKSWLLKNHFADHEWVIWVDADVLFRNQSMKLESILEGRDLLFAKDLCAWPINAGIMGFRNTPENLELLGRIWQRMVDVNDKSTVYSDQGDQHHTILELYESNIINEKHITSSLTINTPPPLSNADTLLTHYVGWSEPYRSVYMAEDDAESMRRG